MFLYHQTKRDYFQQLIIKKLIFFINTIFIIEYFTHHSFSLLPSFKMVKQTKSTKNSQRKSGKRTSNPFAPPIAQFICEEYLSGILPESGQRRNSFPPQWWSKGFGVPEMNYSGPRQKKIHKDAKRKYSRIYFAWLRRQGLLTTRTSLEDVLGEEPTR